MAVEVEDAYLVARAQEGDLAAFEELLHRHNPAAYRVALRLLGDDHDAECVAREALVSAWRNLAQFKGDTPFSIWLYTIVIRTALDKLARGRQGHTAEVPPTPTADEDGAIEGLSRSHTAVAAAVAALPPAQRIALVLHHFEGLPYADVATITGTTIPEVRSQLFQVRRTLAATLGQREVATQ